MRIARAQRARGAGLHALPGRCVRGAPAPLRARLRLPLRRGARGAGARVPELARALGRAAARARRSARSWPASRGPPAGRAERRAGARSPALFGFASALPARGLLAAGVARGRVRGRPPGGLAGIVRPRRLVGGPAVRGGCGSSSRCCSSSAQPSSRSSRGWPRPASCARRAPVPRPLRRSCSARLSPLAGRAGGSGSAGASAACLEPAFPTPHERRALAERFEPSLALVARCAGAACTGSRPRAGPDRRARLPARARPCRARAPGVHVRVLDGDRALQVRAIRACRVLVAGR